MLFLNCRLQLRPKYRRRSGLFGFVDDEGDEDDEDDDDEDDEDDDSEDTDEGELWGQETVKFDTVKSHHNYIDLDKAKVGPPINEKTLQQRNPIRVEPAVS